MLVPSCAEGLHMVGEREESSEVVRLHRTSLQGTHQVSAEEKKGTGEDVRRIFNISPRSIVTYETAIGDDL